MADRLLTAATSFLTTVLANLGITTTPVTNYAPIGQIQARTDETIVLRAWPGITVGTGITAQQRLDNATAIQAFFDYIAANGLIGELPARTIEFTSTQTGVFVKGGIRGLYTKGNQFCKFVEYGSTGANGNPVVQIGSITSGGTDLAGCNIGGIQAEYGTDQTGKTSANAIVLGRVYFSRISDLRHNALDTGFKGYRSIWAPAVSGVFQFSNNCMDWYPQSGQLNLIALESDGTGNNFTNVYCGGGSNTNRNVLTGRAVVLGGTGIQSDMLYARWNIEWQTCNQVGYFKSQRNAGAIGWHLEGNNMTGADPNLFGYETASVTIKGGRALDCQFNTANISGTSAVFRSFDYGESYIVMEDFSFNWDSKGNATYGELQGPISIISNNSNYPRYIKMTNVYFSRANTAKTMPNVQLEASTAPATYGNATYIALWEKFYGADNGGVGAGRGRSVGNSLRNENVTARTLYGRHEDLEVFTGVTAGTSRQTVATTFTLSKNISASATVSGGGMTRKHGDRIRFNLVAPLSGGSYTFKDDAGLTYSGKSAVTTAIVEEWEYDAFANSNAGGWRVNGTLQTAA